MPGGNRTMEELDTVLHEAIFNARAYEKNDADDANYYGVGGVESYDKNHDGLHRYWRGVTH